MRREVWLAALLTSAFPALAQQDRAGDLKARHDADDQRWATTSHLPKADVREIRLAAGISDSSEGVLIRNLDVRSLNSRNHILLVEGGLGNCLRLHVLMRTDAGYKEIWSLSGLRDRGWSMEAIADRPGPGICSLAPQPATSHVTADGQIVVEVPTQSDAFQRSFPVATYAFRWDGKTYAIVEGNRY